MSWPFFWLVLMQSMIAGIAAALVLGMILSVVRNAGRVQKP